MYKILSCFGACLKYETDDDDDEASSVILLQISSRSFVQCEAPSNRPGHSRTKLLQEEQVTLGNTSLKESLTEAIETDNITSSNEGFAEVKSAGKSTTNSRDEREIILTYEDSADEIYLLRKENHRIFDLKDRPYFRKIFHGDSVQNVRMSKSKLLRRKKECELSKKNVRKVVVIGYIVEDKNVPKTTKTARVLELCSEEDVAIGNLKHGAGSLSHHRNGSSSRIKLCKKRAKKNGDGEKNADSTENRTRKSWTRTRAFQSKKEKKKQERKNLKKFSSYEHFEEEDAEHFSVERSVPIVQSKANIGMDSSIGGRLKSGSPIMIGKQVEKQVKITSDDEEPIITNSGTSYPIDVGKQISEPIITKSGPPYPIDVGKQISEPQKTVAIKEFSELSHSNGRIQQNKFDNSLKPYLLGAISKELGSKTGKNESDIIVEEQPDSRNKKKQARKGTARTAFKQMKKKRRKRRIMTKFSSYQHPEDTAISCLKHEDAGTSDLFKGSVDSNFPCVESKSNIEIDSSTEASLVSCSPITAEEQENKQEVKVVITNDLEVQITTNSAIPVPIDVGRQLPDPSKIASKLPHSEVGTDLDKFDYSSHESWFGDISEKLKLFKHSPHNMYPNSLSQSESGNEFYEVEGSSPAPATSMSNEIKEVLLNRDNDSENCEYVLSCKNMVLDENKLKQCNERCVEKKCDDDKVYWDKLMIGSEKLAPNNNDAELQENESVAMHRRVGHSSYEGKIAGLYDLEETLGRGHFAVVKLARHVFTGEKVAVKVIDKSKLDEVSKAHLFQEVRCMKLVQHPNVVRLYEVIDTQTKLYLILELGDGGDLYDYIMRHDSGLSEEVARTYFRQIVTAISYCHRLHVVHRDLKPENVVFFEKLGMVKLTDFGFSNRFLPGQKLETSCGSLAYSAPEILLGDSYDAPAVDVWSLGVILYMLVCGQAPFQEANDSETLTMIMDCKYSIPAHVTDGCKRLIARMLVREPEGRATLQEISTDPWLVVGSDSDPIDSLPLISRQHVSEEHHNLIITKMVNGNIASKQEILDALDKNEYNHITATYFLLAERKLRARRQEEVQKSRPELLNISTGKQNNISSNNLQVDQNLGNVNQSLLNVPRTPGDVPQNFRARKCSIVQEEDDEDDMSSCSGRDEHGSNSALSSLNRRGSRSEGKLSHVLQERLSQHPEKHSSHKAHPHVVHSPITLSVCDEKLKMQDETDRLIQDSNKSGYTGVGKLHTTGGLENVSGVVKVNVCDDNVRNRLGNAGQGTQPGGWMKKSNNLEGRPKSVTECLKSGPVPTNKWRMGAKHQAPPVPDKFKSPLSMMPPTTTTTILTESSTVSIPLRTTTGMSDSQLTPKYKTMPSPNSTASPQPALNEILEDGDLTSNEATGKTRIVRRIGYEQRRSKFHKSRTASCSSSDASDDDSEGRKKRANKLGNSGKPLPPPRRDSHDDSSDSQDPGGSGGGTGGCGGGNGRTVSGTGNRDCTRGPSGTENSKTTSGSNGTTGGKRCGDNQTIAFGRRHRTGRRRSGETRLRESQSLNRITEVQEAEGPCHAHNHNVVFTQSISISHTVAVQKAKGFGARLLQSWSLSSSSSKKTQVLEDKGNLNHSAQEEKTQQLRKSQGVNAVVLKGVSCAKDDRTIGDRNEEAADSPRVKSPSKSSARSQNEEKENRNAVNKSECKSKKMRLLSRYFAVHKKLCIPLPGLFGKGRLYKAQSCGSIARDRVAPPSPKSMLLCSDDKWRDRRQWCDVKQQHRGSDGDINQNLGLAHLVDSMGKGCPGLPTVCHIHLGDASKCCSLC